MKSKTNGRERTRQKTERDDGETGESISAVVEQRG